MMEKALSPEKEKGEDAETPRPLIEELKKVSYIALPMILVTVSQYLLRASPVIMLGHIDELFLASSSIATSFCNVTGFSLLVGMSSALETLCGQAYGAGQHTKLGSYTYCGIISLILVCIPVSILWIFVEDILIFLGQDVAISREAGNYAIWLIPTLFPYAILQSLNRFLQTQSLILPMLLTSLISICFHLPVCWAFIFKLNLGNAGAALSIGLSYSLNTILLVLYVKYSPTCENTWVPFSTDVFTKIGEFFRFAIPSAVMVCLEWWSFELVILFSGLLPNPQLETSVLSICLNISSLHYFIPYSFAVAVSTRVSNELGAGNPQRAKIALCVVVVLASSEFLLASAILFCCRHILGYGFSNEKEVVDYVGYITPLLCLSIIVDSVQTVLSGVSRGSGWQHIGAYINLGSYYIVGIPLSLALGFVFRLKGPGLWIGLLAGSTTQSALLSLITCLTDWRKLFGMSSALETLCGQAYGAEQFHKLGAYTGGAILSLFGVCIPLSVLFLFLDEVLEFIGQDPQISREAGRYAVCLIPTLFPYAILQLLIRYLQTQSLIVPMLLSSIAALLFHVPVCWLLVYKFDSGAAGAALAIGLSYWLNVILLGIYVKYSSACQKTRISFSIYDFPSIKEFFRFAIPSALMVCLEWWSCEIVVLLSGTLPNPQLESSVLSICMLTASLHYFVPFSIGAAASTRVSNELGAGNPKRAQVAVWAVCFLAVMEVLIATIVLISCRNVLGYAFSNSEEVVSYMKDIIPLVCLSLFMDGIQAVLSGVARGCGWQHLGAYVNLGAYYLVGIPVAILLGFALHLGGTGLWMGINAGSIVQVTLLSIVTSRTNWQKQASIVRERIFEERVTAEK